MHLCDRGHGGTRGAAIALRRIDKLKMHTMDRLVVLLAAGLLLAAPLAAQHAAERAPESAPHEEGAAHFRHHLALTPSLTTLLRVGGEEAATLPTLAIDFEEHIGEVLGAGLYVEALFGKNENAVMAGLPFFVHPFGHFHFLVAPEMKWAEADEAWERTAGLRVGTAYDLHFAHLSVSPTLNADFLHGQTELNYGLSVGWGF